jgi:2-keto-4-pentenoate hydratase/2-oxohepta-3-ene-1,7-dioic acid hydratase in catechol pathway
MNDVPRLEIPTIAAAHSNARFPVRRIFCVGQNYADHAREMGSDPDRQPPLFFSAADIIAFLSTYVAVAAGDLIFTGTPAGVGPIQRGEFVRGAIEGIDPVEVTFE